MEDGQRPNESLEETKREWKRRKRQRNRDFMVFLENLIEDVVWNYIYKHSQGMNMTKSSLEIFLFKGDTLFHCKFFEFEFFYYLSSYYYYPLHFTY